MNLEQLKSKLSPAAIARNAHIFSVRALEGAIAEHLQRSEGENQTLDRGPQSMGVRVVIVSLRKRLLDSHDNLPGGAKPLVDAITKSIGFTDDARITWEYHQLRSEVEGTLVTIQAYENQRPHRRTVTPEPGEPGGVSNQDPGDAHQLVLHGVPEPRIAKGKDGG